MPEGALFQVLIVSFFVRTVEVEFEGEIYEVYISDGILSLSLGMRFRTEGRMLFVFPRKSRPMIDMMFVPVPLQLVFLDEDRKVVDVQEAEPWTLNPRTWKIYGPEEDCSYLLESTEPLDIEEGDFLEFEI